MTLKPEPDRHAEAPWKRRYRASSIAGTQLAARAPSRGVACTNQSGKYQLYAWDRAAGTLRQLTDHPTAAMLGVISPDGRWVYTLQDTSGNETGHYVRLPFEGGEPLDLTPGFPPYSSFRLVSSRSGDRLAFTLADKAGMRAYCLDLDADGAPQKRRLIYESASFAKGPNLSADGCTAVIMATERSVLQHYSLVSLDALTGERLGELWDGDGMSVELGAAAPVPGDSRFLAASDRGGLWRPLIWDARSGARLDLHVDELDGEVTPIVWSPDARQVLLLQVHAAREQLHVFDLEAGKATRLEHPEGSFRTWGSGGTYWAGGEIFAQWTDWTHPAEVIALDPENGKPWRTVLAAGTPISGRSLESITYPSAGGQAIQGWLGVPEGEGPFPTILHMHGGPEKVTAAMYMPAFQCWLDHGFAVLSINYRGSITFGKAFQQSIWGDIGHWEAEDMAAAYRWLWEHDIARCDQVFLTGRSYGGYLTLLGLGKYPELWAGGMVESTSADWTMTYESTTPNLARYGRALFGGTPQEKPEVYAAASPITYVERVRAPVLIIQGRNDARATPRSIEIYEARLRELGRHVEVHWFDAGHLGGGIEQDIVHQGLMVDFAYRVLGERAAG